MGGGPPGFPQGFSCLVVLWILLAASRFRLPGFHRLRLAFPKPFVYLSAMLIAVRNPEEPGPSVWPLSRSLATTYGISFDVSSSPYLDVSVQAVPFQYLWIQYWIMEYELHWVAPFRYLRINGCLLLPEAFRSLPRLSSAPSAKAFTLRPF